MWLRHTISGFAAVFAVATACACPAAATDGYFQTGYGARQQGLAGAGVADSRDGTAASLNPAGIIHAPTEIIYSFSGLYAKRQIEGTGAAGFTPSGPLESENNWFLVTNSASTYRLNWLPFFDVVTTTSYSNSGINSEYQGATANACASGVFCGGKAGLNLQQYFYSIAGAKRFGNLSVGIAPVVALQTLEVKGLSALPLASSDPGNLTNRNTDLSWGGGLRAGIEWSLTPSLRFGLAGSTPIWMSRFEDYRGLLADGGSFDIPATAQVGVAYDVSPTLTVMLDYKRIWYSGTAALANSSSSPGLLGAADGPGFGWRDIDIAKLGVEYRISDSLTLRAGYSYNTSPIKSADVTTNILLPYTTQHHLTAGATWRLAPSLDLEFAAIYAPNSSISGAELAAIGNPAHTIELSSSQLELTAGFKYRFGN